MQVETMPACLYQGKLCDRPHHDSHDIVKSSNDMEPNLIRMTSKEHNEDEEKKSIDIRASCYMTQHSRYYGNRLSTYWALDSNHLPLASYLVFPKSLILCQSVFLLKKLSLALFLLHIFRLSEHMLPRVGVADLHNLASAQILLSLFAFCADGIVPPYNLSSKPQFSHVVSVVMITRTTYLFLGRFVED